MKDDNEQAVVAWGAIVLTVFIVLFGLGVQVLAWIVP